MLNQIQEKIDSGFSCIKMKIGIELEEELLLLKEIRKSYSANQIELRVDANGAFSPDEALRYCNQLYELDIHSIEQPLHPKFKTELKNLCESSQLPIALDESLIRENTYDKKQALLERVQPKYIVIKPSLVGGFKHTDEWIAIAESLNIGWWMTSALESNIGLNAIAQFTFQKEVNHFQGLGTGSLYTNNFSSPLYIKGECIGYDPDLNWDLSLLENEAVS